MTLSDCDRFRHRHDLPDVLSCRFTGKRQRRFDFGVLWKVFRVREIKRTAAWIEPVRALLFSLERVGDLMNVAKVEVRRVNQDAIPFFGRDLESPQRRFSECVFYCDALIGIVADRAKVVIRRDQQDSWSTPIKTHDRAVAELSAIEADIV